MATRRRALKPRGSTMVVWGWYSIFVLPMPETGGSAPGLVKASTVMRAFWAVWWTEDPRRMPDADPDDYGFIEGAKVADVAIGVAYDALRAGRGPKVHDMSLGPSYAQRAHREGAPRRRSTATDFEALALEGFTALGLTSEATLPEIRKAFAAMHPDRGGTNDVDMARLAHLYNAVVSFVKKREADALEAAIQAGTAVPKVRKKRRGPEAPLEQGALVSTEVTGVAVELDADALLDRTRKVALRVRVLLEKYAKTAEGEDPESLKGLCMGASLGLVEALRVAGVRARGACGTCFYRPHHWVEVPLPDVNAADPGYLIVDITATQFRKTWPRVLILLPDAKRREVYRRRAGGGMVTSFQDEQLERMGKRLPERWWVGS